VKQEKLDLRVFREKQVRKGKLDPRVKKETLVTKETQENQVLKA
jgi:hypothetical protein